MAAARPHRGGVPGKTSQSSVIASLVAIIVFSCAAAAGGHVGYRVSSSVGATQRSSSSEQSHRQQNVVAHLKSFCPDTVCPNLAEEAKREEETKDGACPFLEQSRCHVVTCNEQKKQYVIHSIFDFYELGLIDCTMLFIKNVNFMPLSQ
jgi:F0F1-type ATP synthase membrane subunit c/vacuolar-type H+-ATPase subunit K